MGKSKSEKFLFLVAVMDVVNTAVQWFTQVSSFGWSRDTWLGIGIITFMIIVLALVFIGIRAYPKEKGVQSGSKTKSKVEIDKQANELKSLKELRDNELSNLKLTNPTLIMSKLDSVQFQGLSNLEPYITVTIIFINCSMFKVKLDDIKFTSKLNETDLILAPTLNKDTITSVYYGDKRTLTFTQPITSTTSEFLKNSIDKHNKITWQFYLKANLIIEDTKDVSSFTHLLTFKEMPLLEN